jgi:hypothetical protein
MAPTAVDAPPPTQSQTTQIEYSLVPEIPKNQGIGYSSPPEPLFQPFIPSFGPMETQFIGRPLEFVPLQVKKFSNTTHRFTLNPNKKRRASTSSPSLRNRLQTPQNEETSSQSYKELILKARELVTEASLKAPTYEEKSQILDLLEVFRDYTERGRISNFSKIIGSQVSNLEQATRKIERIAKAPPKPTPIATIAIPETQPVQKPPSLAQIASQGAIQTTSTPQEWKLVQKRTTKSSEEASKPQPKACKRLILYQAPKDSTSPILPLTLRNAFNKAFADKGVQGPVVNTISRTRSNNIVVTTTSSFSAAYLLEKKPIWEKVLPFKSAQIDETWYKVVVHGIPIRDFDTPKGMELVVDEITTFNQGLKPIGTPYWLTTKEKRKSQLAGSIVVAFASEVEATRAIRSRLFIGGISARVEKLYSVAPTTQCGKCQGYGHLDNHCKKEPQCRLCAENHPTAYHQCSICPTKGKRCPHLAPKCANCKGAHIASSETCELLLAIKSRAKC